MENINDFAVVERLCENEFISRGPFWHLCTPGERQEMIFRNEDEFKFGVTSAALALSEVNAAGCSVKMYAFALMNNHIHELLAGTREDCMEYFRIRRAKLVRYFGKEMDLSGFVCELIRIDDVGAFRNEVAYIHRNGFVVNQKETPFSYEWSSGRYYFNPVVKEIPLMKVSALSYREKKAVLKCKGTKEYDDMLLTNGYVSPLCFCDVGTGMALFRNAHQYFHKISRVVETYASIAKSLGDKVFLNDEELFTVVCRRAREMYNVNLPKLVPAGDKLEIAKWMHYEYNASNGQIVRILKIERGVVDSLFPIAK